MIFVWCFNFPSQKQNIKIFLCNLFQIALVSVLTPSFPAQTIPVRVFLWTRLESNSSGHGEEATINPCCTWNEMKWNDLTHSLTYFEASTQTRLKRTKRGKVTTAPLTVFFSIKNSCKKEHSSLCVCKPIVWLSNLIDINVIQVHQ